MLALQEVMGASPRKRWFTLTILVLIFIFYNMSTFSRQKRDEIPAINHHMRLPCLDLPGAHETLVIIKTGSTELEARLPVHLSTTLQCYPHHLIFSDNAEILDGRVIIDALEYVSPEIKENHADFQLYRRLREKGRNGLSPSELRGEVEAVSSGGHSDNPGWRLDKWKFLPMVNQTFARYPDMKWYVFAEADTYLLWGSLLEHLATLNHSQTLYTGVRVFIGDVGFAHGGAGFIVSQPAMRLVVDHYRAHQQEIEAFTSGHWAGDCVLGKAFADVDVPITEAWPVMQGDQPGKVAYLAPDGRPIPFSDGVLGNPFWCRTSVSFHRMQPEMVEDLWSWEQRWLREGQKPKLLHSDVFKNYILPRIQEPRSDWDNESGNDDDSDVVLHAPSFQACRHECEATTDCLQYSFDERDHRCRHYSLPRLGRPMPGMKSGWLVQRIDEMARPLGTCD